VSDLGVDSGKPAVVLLHPFLLSGKVWQDVVPLLSNYHQVFTPTLLGHRAGPPVRRRPVTIWDVIDAAEGYLDEHGLQRPHLVGNSAGGFVALELARRGRAAAVCALSPAGFWSITDGSKSRADKKVLRTAMMSRLAIPVGPLVFKSATVRRLSLRFLNTARHGDRITAAQLYELCQDTVGCTVTNELFSTDDEQIAPLDPVPCPITIAWSEKDSLLPVATYGKIARERVPQATFEILPGMNHVPMIDDPDLVARTILAVTGAAKR
jgi:pimeloyl-ACP methyl ester carboxylesterase